MFYYIGILATVLLIIFAILYSLLGYNIAFRDRFVEYLTDQANRADMRPENELSGERVYVPREDRRSVRTLVYRYAGEDPSPVLFYAHGGDFVSGDSDLSDEFCREISEKWKVSVVNISYSKIREHVTSYPQEEIRDAVLWFVSHADEYRFEKRRFILMGEEAGAYLSLLAGVMLVRQAVVPSGFVFVNPFIDYVAVSLAVAGMHPGPVAVAVTEMTDKTASYDEELYRAGVFVKTKISQAGGASFADDEELRNWVRDRIDDFLRR